METIKQVLMHRDNMLASEADSLIAEAKADFDYAIKSGDNERAEEICAEYFGLEPDFIMELFD